MKNILLISCLFFLLFSCQNNTNQHKIHQEKTIINIIPLGVVDSSVLLFAKKSIEKFYQYKCSIQLVEPISDELLTKSKTRYDANLILNKFNSKKNQLLLTSVDIAHHKSDAFPEWGIFGLGYRPGSTCVVSTFRLKSGVSDTKMKERLEKVCIHEIGHNLGLPHCTFAKDCLMNDANGTIQQVDDERIYFCKNCMQKLQHK